MYLVVSVFVSGLVAYMSNNSVATWFVPKVSVLIFYLNVYWTHLKLQVIPFKV